MQTLARVFASRRRYEVAQKLSRLQRGPFGAIGEHAPGLSGWTDARDLPEVPAETFREWWRARGRAG